MAEEELHEEKITGRRYAPGDQVYDLYSIAAALAAYSQGGSYTDPGYAGGGGGGGGGNEPAETITVSAPRPTPTPSPTPTPRPTPPRTVYLGPQIAPAQSPAPDSAFVAPLKTITIEGTRVRPAAPRPAPVRSVPARGFGLLALVPLWMAAMGKLDELGTEAWRKRIGPPRPPTGSRIARPELPPDPFGYGRPRPWGISGPPLPSRQPRTGDRTGQPRIDPGADDDIQTITITAPIGVPVPVRAPTFVPVELPIPRPAPSVGEPSPWLAPNPSVVPVPGPAPQPSPFPWAAPSPGLSPTPAPAPAPAPGPSTPTRPRPGVTPLPSFLPTPALFAQPQPNMPVPPQKADPCNCAEKKPKKPKKKNDRTECWGGTYIEKARGLSKRRRERVDCNTGKPIGSKTSKPPAPKRKKSKSPNPPPPSWEIPPP